MAERKMSSAKSKGGSKRNASSAEKKNERKNGSAANRAAESMELSRSPLPVRGIAAGICFVLGVLNLMACFGLTGSVLTGVRSLICGLFGVTGFYVAPIVWLLTFYLLLFRRGRGTASRGIFAFLSLLTIGAMAHLLTASPDLLKQEGALIKILYITGAAGTSGGLFCGLLAVGLERAISRIGAIIILCPCAIISILSACNMTIPSIVRAVHNRPRPEPEEEEPAEPIDPAVAVVNHFANKHIERVQRKRKASDFDLPVDDTPVDAPAARQSRLRRSTVPSPDAFLESQLGKRPSPPQTPVDEPFDGEPITGRTVIPAAKEAADAARPQEAPQPDTPDTAVPDTQAPDTEFLHSREKPQKTELPVEAAAAVQTQLSGPVMSISEEMPPVISAANLPQREECIEKTNSDTRKEISAEETRSSAQEVAEEIAQNAAVQKPEYCFPPIELLNPSPAGVADGTTEMRENSRRLSETLESFKIDAHICNVTRGPSVTRYELELDKGVRLSKITALADDIALALGASGVRISAIPDKISVVGIEVPNKQVTTVMLREVLASPQFIRARSRSSFAVGKDIGGVCIVGDIARLPHMLIAGTTGSGKSVCMNSIIISLLYKARPEEVKLIMVDPKMVELGVYNGIPHLLIPVVTDPKKAAGALQWAVTEMMRRYKTMSDAGVRDMDSFNKVVESEGEGEKLPQIVVVIDELADLMLVAAKEVEESICRIAQMGRAAGIHLIIATQRPSADVITGLMKANIPSRIAFAVASAMESRIILDTQGAEKLVGRGDMLYAPLGQGKPQRIQGCFISDQEVESVASYVKSHYVPSYSQEVMDEIEKKAEQSGGKASSTADSEQERGEDGDELLPAAVEVILETGQASVSMLQRRLKLGYARAARIVDEMEEKGIVGPFVGSKPRAILISKEQWAQIQSGHTPEESQNFEDIQQEPTL